MSDVRRNIQNGARRWKWLLRRAGMEACAAPLAIVMVVGGFSLLFNHPPRDAGPLLFPVAFGYVLLFLGVCGIWGLTFKSSHALMVFSFFGMMARTWMAVLYFLRDPRDLSWLSFAVGAACAAWIFGRVVCDATARAVRRKNAQREK